MSPLGERVPVRAVRRGDDVVVGERAADPDVDRLLADRDVKEARQLARPEALLDLLLEPPDQEHLPEELAQRLFRDPAALFDFRHGPDSTLRGDAPSGVSQNLARAARASELTPAVRAVSLDRE
jgi:hypothetical protein